MPELEGVPGSASSAILEVSGPPCKLPNGPRRDGRELALA